MGDKIQFYLVIEFIVHACMGFVIILSLFISYISGIKITFNTIIGALIIFEILIQIMIPFAMLLTGIVIYIID